MNLNQTILDEILKEEYPSGKIIGHSGEQVKEAALLAMDRQAEFYRHLSKEKWVLLEETGWFNRNTHRDATELELYQIWREGK